ncbi:MAG: GNAT family N-acetyltransferase [Paucibacter sp.]|nr:GNAT family N-acetyltransferase [Roseateles sp.]
MLERRPAKPDDLPFLLQLRQQTFRAYLAEAGVPIDADSDLARVMFKFEVAEILLHQGAAAGLLKMSRSGPAWQIHQLQIAPALQGRGLGAALLQQLQDEAAEAGVGIALGVLKRNPAQALYRRLGFVDSGENELEYLLRWPVALPPASNLLAFANTQWRVRRPKPFVLVIEGELGVEAVTTDYLHDKLLLPDWREAFYQLVDATGLVVCLNLHTQHPTYRDVRGRSSKGRLSQGEYYHHDGCSGPTKPRFVEIRCPIQPQTRGVATAVAPHRAVVAAMVQVLPAALAAAPALALQDLSPAALEQMDDAALDQLQGLLTRTVRKKLDAEGARAYFRQVDLAADAYFEPWALGESRIIANANSGVTMQHRRAYQTAHTGGVANGHLVKRWPNEELLLPGQVADPALIAALCREEGEESEDPACYLGPH